MIHNTIHTLTQLLQFQHSHNVLHYSTLIFTQNVKTHSVT